MWAQTLIAPQRFAMQQVARPDEGGLAAGEVLLRLRAGSVCGSDLACFRGESETGTGIYGVPGRPMHEVVGTVVHAGDSGFTAGQRVVGWAKRMRGLAEFLVANADQLTPVDDVWDDVHATVIQPLACVLHAASRLRGIDGATVAVLGQGPLGLLFSRVLKDAGAKHVTAVDYVDRSGAAAEFGVDQVVADHASNWARKLDAGQRPHIVVEAVGHNSVTLNDAIHAVGMNGQIFAFGVPGTDHYALDFLRMFRKNATLHSGTTLDHARHLEQAQCYLQRNQGLAHSYITDVFSTADAQGAYLRACQPDPARLKVALVAPSPDQL